MNAFFTDNFHISNIVYCGIVPMNNWSCYKKNRRTHGLIFQVSGEKRYDFDYPVCREHIDIVPGDIYYLPKGSDYLVTDIGYGDCIAVDFTLAEEDKVYAYFHFSPQSKKYAPLFEKVLSHWEKKEAGYLNRCMALLYEIISEMQADAKPHYLASKTTRLAQRGVEIMRKNIGDPALSIAKIANELSVSSEHFRKIFAEVYHQSPRKYLVHLRFEKAKELLLSGEYKIATVAQRCGFETPSYFCRAFLKSFGYTPTDFLKQK